MKLSQDHEDKLEEAEEAEKCTTVLGDSIYFAYVTSQLNMDQNWSPPVKLLRYFRNFTEEAIARIANGKYVNPSFFQHRDKRFSPVNDDLYHLSTGGYGIVFRLDDYVVKFVFEQGANCNPMDTTTEYTVPRFLYNNLKGDERMLVVCALTMGLNYRIGFLHTLYRRVLHMLLLLLCLLEGRPLSLEFSSKKFIREFVARKDSTRFVRLLSYFYPAVIQSNINVINHFDHMVHFFEHEKRAKYTYDRGNIIVFPLARCSADRVTEASAEEMGFKSVRHFVKFMFLQMALLYIKIYEMPGCDNFIHADLKPDNVLVFDSQSALTIEACGLTYVFKERVRCALNDFDFSQVGTILNKKVKASLRVDHNWYYDFHFFVHTLLRTYPEVEKDPVFHAGLTEFVMCCTKSTCDKFRLRVSIMHPIGFLERFVTRDIFSEWING
ncbi:serine/threonine protein kinase [Squirrelpox virus]|uniref:Serine/threonine-protein kinase n=1 Tax=Squirrelpox virus TaxID=240426 RepID=Q1HTU1_9POXV|nr:serine/threonine protein kinase [Squirrelpox virus]ABD51445.1 A3L [Squirrelpox virus]CCD83194.1 serine/threonine protein kinase [Squirrelpox virus]